MYADSQTDNENRQIDVICLHTSSGTYKCHLTGFGISDPTDQLSITISKSQLALQPEVSLSPVFSYVSEGTTITITCTTSGADLFTFVQITDGRGIYIHI